MDERDAAARRKVTDRASGRQPSGFSGGHRSPQVRSNLPSGKKTGHARVEWLATERLLDVAENGTQLVAALPAE